MEPFIESQTDNNFELIFVDQNIEILALFYIFYSKFYS